MKIIFVTFYNPYHSLQYMCEHLGEEFKKKGFEVEYVDYKEQARFFSLIEEKGPHLFCSFSEINVKALTEIMRIRDHRWVYLRVDPVEELGVNLLDHPRLFVGHVDKDECAYLQEAYPNANVEFFPHSTDSTLSYDEQAERPYEVVFCASSYDHETVLRKIETQTPQEQKFIIESIEKYQNDPNITTKDLLVGAELKKKNTYRYLIDTYVRAKDRFDLISSITDAHIHLVGGTGFDSAQFPVRGWSEIFWDKPNVTIYPAMNFEETFDVMRKAKIVLNSMPFFKNGTHERVFNSLALGAVPLTTRNKWFAENFVEGEEVVFQDRKNINAQVRKILNDEEKRRAIARKGREKVMKEYIWEKRVAQILRWVEL